MQNLLVTLKPCLYWTIPIVYPHGLGVELVLFLYVQLLCFVHLIVVIVQDGVIILLSVLK